MTMFPQRRPSPPSVIALLIASLVTLFSVHHVVNFPVVSATSVKWIPGNNGNNDNNAAATAPRSQKYWDEHGIERPEYGKSDAEIAAERRAAAKKNGGSTGASNNKKTNMMLIIGATAIGCYIYTVYTKQTGQSGNRLGSSNSNGGVFGDNGVAALGRFGGGCVDADKARMARLARFEVSAQEKDE
mmetsp:Transcript_36957/g.54250  ORF Transcript_36957/g.54250 Transcript_36957/m.54250 type:complete len:186 (+) Transcript_36957:297-854(+)|eukprot:CAMPEP_0195524748 /NCGR_PEP_ID=MMETSP0794_2-20130614/24778_1 /TAXON_ID=515487 /ORGANISM="Stephanopyxis turris, Strain CCMP 815" /LENGTH=185 /DNA_ID=CAMNT_0040655037 /DNA_START=286 /DNA_END=843 /DNA_ORIENTATION=-